MEDNTLCYLIIDKQYLIKQGHVRALRFAMVCSSVVDAILFLEARTDHEYLCIPMTNSDYEKMQGRIKACL